jgi:hypothetical protein
LKPSDSAPVFQRVSEPSSGFLTKILGVETPLFLCNTQFYFPPLSLLLHKSHRSERPYVHLNNSDGGLFAYSVGFWGSFLNEVIFVTDMSIMVLEAVKFYLFFNPLYLFIYFLSSFVHIREREEFSWFLNVKG